MSIDIFVSNCIHLFIVILGSISQTIFDSRNTMATLKLLLIHWWNEISFLFTSVPKLVGNKFLFLFYPFMRYIPLHFGWWWRQGADTGKDEDWERETTTGETGAGMFRNSLLVDLREERTEGRGAGGGAGGRWGEGGFWERAGAKREFTGAVGKESKTDTLGGPERSFGKETISFIEEGTVGGERRRGRDGEEGEEEEREEAMQQNWSALTVTIVAIHQNDVFPFTLSFAKWRACCGEASGAEGGSGDNDSDNDRQLDGTDLQHSGV